MIPQNTCKAHGTQLAQKKGTVILLFLSTTTKDLKKKRLIRKINQSLG